MRYILLLFILGVNFMFGTMKSVDAHKLQQMIKDGVVVIDIRREDEFKYFGIIEGSITLTFFDERGQYDQNKWLAELQKYVTDKEQTFVIYCAHANRTKVVGDFLEEQVGYKNIYELEGGINYGWLDKGFKTVKYQ